MIGLALVSSAILVFQPAQAPHPDVEKKATVPVPAPGAADNDPSKAMAEYITLREKTPATAAGQWKLGLWCEKNGLKPEAYVHFSEAARLDPRHDAVWKKLGFKKSGGRWMSSEQITEETEQKKADKIWAPKLKKLHRDIHGTNGVEKRDAARTALGAIADPRAVLPLYREFGGGQVDQLILIQALGQIDRPISSQVLAMLAVYGRTPEVRGRATETLRSRPAGDFIDLLVGLMVDPITYEVRPVGGPGSPGVLFVEGERFNSARFYAPPPAPNVAVGPGDIVTYDASGMLVIAHRIGSFGGVASTTGVPGSKDLVKETTREIDFYERISPYELMLEAQRGAVMAQAQLERDVAAIKAINEDRRQFNDRVMGVAREITGKDHGRTPKEWREALIARWSSPRQPVRPSAKPTVPELAPLDYNPVFGPIGFASQLVIQTRVYVDT